ncbi:MAG: hypothetical protein JJ959_08050 [Nisaea sp.]|uniref:hypothetical protein n=1 Tax=Nisaea sp. TaxID=2024842 RepID=UPI001B0293AF|nr:hypothetical protein [Nisaea sp.]MBO6560473.1 hypothetical protein [Nisaea sp.]
MPAKISISDFLDLFEREHETEIFSEQTMDYFNFEEAHGDADGYAVETGYIVREVSFPGFRLQSRIGYIHHVGSPEEAEYIPALPPVPITVEIDTKKYAIVTEEGAQMTPEDVQRRILAEFPTVYRFPINILDVVVVSGSSIREHGAITVSVRE